MRVVLQLLLLVVMVTFLFLLFLSLLLQMLMPMLLVQLLLERVKVVRSRQLQCPRLRHSSVPFRQTLTSPRRLFGPAQTQRRRSFLTGDKYACEAVGGPPRPEKGPQGLLLLR